MAASRCIGILAGGGSLPREIADSIAARGLPLHIVALSGETDADFGAHPVTRVSFGEIGRMVKTLRAAGCTDLVIIGAVKRPDLGAIKPDLGFFRALATVARLVLAGGDDSVLRGVIRFFEKHGFRVIGPEQVAPELVIGAQTLSRLKPDAAMLADARLGFDLVGQLGAFDIGQAAIVTDGRIEAIEGAEGTDRLLVRVAEARRRRGLPASTARGILVKRAKPAQDRRIDLPVIGPGTITRAIEVGLAGIVVEAGRVLAAARPEMALRAETSGLVVAGVEVAASARATDATRTASAAAGAGELQVLTERKPRARAVRDVRKALAIGEAMRAFGGTRAVMVVRGHVLAVESGEGVEDTIARASGLRQWGDRRLAWRAGVLSLTAGRDCTAETVAAARKAGFAGIVVGLKRFKAGVAADVIAAADKSGLFIAGVHAEDETHG